MNNILKYRLNSKEISELQEQIQSLITQASKLSDRVETLLSENKQILNNLPDE